MVAQSVLVSVLIRTPLQGNAPRDVWTAILRVRNPVPVPVRSRDRALAAPADSGIYAESRVSHTRSDSSSRGHLDVEGRKHTQSNPPVRCIGVSAPGANGELNGVSKPCSTHRRIGERVGAHHPPCRRRMPGPRDRLITVVDGRNRAPVPKVHLRTFDPIRVSRTGSARTPPSEGCVLNDSRGKCEGGAERQRQGARWGIP